KATFSSSQGQRTIASTLSAEAVMIPEVNLKTATGAGIRVALIDSGVNSHHSHVGFLAGGVSFSLAADGGLQQHEDYTDQIGHGPALAGILRAKAPQVELHAVKIFADRLSTTIAILEAGLRWAVEHQMRIINLSLGTANPAHRDRLGAIVAQAHATGAF